MSTLFTVPKPKERVERGLLAPTRIAHLLVQKYRVGLPFRRQERMLAVQGIRLDDVTMSRYSRLFLHSRDQGPQRSTS